MLQVIASDAQVVKGKPYSADTTTETVQTLADGNRMVHRTVSKIYRDRMAGRGGSRRSAMWTLSRGIRFDTSRFPFN